jgi:hypothetical protein
MIPNTTPTPNIIFNGLMRKMNDTEFRIVMLVVRATLGWIADKESGMRKVEDWISSSQLREKTGRQSGAISKAIDHCIQEGWIEARNKNGEILDTKEKRKGKNLYFRLGKSILFDTSSESEDVVVKDKKDYPPLRFSSPTSSENEVQPLRKANTTKETTTKEIIQKDATEQSSENIKARGIISLFREVNPSYERLFSRKAEWAAARRMLKIHGEESLCRIIDGLRFSNNQPYAPVITRPIELEEKWGKLMAFLSKNKRSHAAVGSKYESIKTIKT